MTRVPSAHIVRSGLVIAAMGIIVAAGVFAALNHNSSVSGVTLAGQTLDISNTGAPFNQTNISGITFSNLHLGTASTPQTFYIANGNAGSALSNVTVSVPNSSIASGIFTGSNTNASDVMITVKNLGNDNSITASLAQLNSSPAPISGDPTKSGTQYSISAKVTSSDGNSNVNLGGSGIEIDFTGNN